MGYNMTATFEDGRRYYSNDELKAVKEAAKPLIEFMRGKWGEGEYGITKRIIIEDDLITICFTEAQVFTDKDD